MSFDGTFIHCLLAELRPLIEGGKISKVQMISPFELILTIRKNRIKQNLEISIHPEFQRINIVKNTSPAPERPFPFTMTMRKYIQGAKIEKIEQVGNDRIVIFDLTNSNEVGDKTNFSLIAEMLGRHANLILTTGDENKIIDLLKKSSIDNDQKRIMLPGFNYELPTLQQKLNPFSFISEQNKLSFPKPTELEINEFLKYFQGFGKDSTKELKVRMLNNGSKAGWDEFFNELKDPQAAIYYRQDNDPNYFTPIIYNSIKEKYLKLSSLSELLDKYFSEKSSYARNTQAAKTILIRVEGLIKKDQRKLIKLKQDLKKANNAEQDKIKGDLINIHLNEFKKGSKNIKVDNVYDPGNLITIDLNPELTPQQNAQKFYKKYRKRRDSLIHINEQIKITEKEIEYLDTIMTQIELADVKTIEDIKEELILGHYLKVQHQVKRAKRSVSKPLEFMSTDGTKILLGRSNIQNEQLTLHQAKKSDYWLHTKNIPGSHVILETNEPSEETLYEGAMLAAYYSKSRNSAQVPVDYVQVKLIKKPRGTNPGFVTYTNQKTLYVTPNSELVDKLRM